MKKVLEQQHYEMLEDISLCRDGCFCMTKTIKGRCGKCGKIKKENGRKK